MIPSADELLADFHEKFVAISKEMYELGIREKVVRDKEVAEFWKAIKEAKDANTLEATTAISSFMEIKKKVLNINFT